MSAPALSSMPGTERLREDLLHPDPLLDCLLEVCRLHGQAATRAALCAGLPLHNGQLTLSCIDRAAQRAGMSAKLQRVALDALDPAAFPVILILKDKQACVWVAAQPNAEAPVQVLLPQSGSGTVSLSRDELRARYSGIALFIRPQFRLDARSSGADAPADGHWFWSALLSQRFVYLDVLWAALLINLFALAFPLFSRIVYDRVVPNNALETLWALAVGLVLVLAADLTMRLLRGRFVDEASARIDKQISASIMARVLGMRLEHRPQSVGSFAANLRGFEQVRDFIASSTVTALIDLPFAAVFIVVMAWISPWLAVPVLTCFALILLMAYVLQHRLHQLAQSSHQASAMRHATLVESLTGIETIKSQGAEASVQARWERNNVFLAGVNVQMRSLTAWALNGAGWLQQLVSVVVILIGVYLIGERQLTMGALIACTMLASRALAPAGQLAGLLMQYQGARTALRALEHIMHKPLERDDGTHLIQRRELSGTIEFRQVKFAYPESQQAALDGVSFTIRSGERVALIGKVGSGKTTLQKLMLGLYQPTEGAVLLDGVDLRQLDPADVRRNLAYVSQDVTLFWGTLRENIAYGWPQAEDAAVLAAAEVAGLSAFVNRHPKGFDLPVGERGEWLSGGQRQGVGIARAVLHHAPVLLLDEPTSAMDYSTEAEVTAKLSAWMRGKTMVLVTHRSSMLALAERIIVIDQGRIVADGPREQVLHALASGHVTRAA